MKHLLPTVILIGLTACTTSNLPPAERLYDVWEVDARDSLAQDPTAKAVKGSQYQSLLKLVSGGVGTHRYEFRRTGELAFGVETLIPIAHFSVGETKQGRLQLSLKDVGLGIDRTETAELWFIDGQLYFRRGTQTLVMDPD